MAATAGRFTIEGDSITGPGDYMNEQGNAKLDKILAGNDTVFNMCVGYSPNIEVAICVALQTDYAGWLGFKEMMAYSKPRST